jgi:trehalose-6-phosphate synthase
LSLAIAQLLFTAIAPTCRTVFRLALLLVLKISSKVNIMTESGQKPKGRLLVVANRLPVSITAKDNGQFDYKMGSGGLVSGLQSLSKAMEFIWFGWAGTIVHRNDQQKVQDHLEAEFNAVPIFLSKDSIDKYYSGFSSKSLQSQNYSAWHG